MVILEKKVHGAGPAELERFARKVQSLVRVAGEVDVLITGNRRVQELNRRFRRKNKPTDVLSFPREQGGDIAVSAEIARENARRYGHSPADEIKILVLHGMLHLAGYDHESDNGSMAAREAKLRAQLRLPGSLIERAHGKTVEHSRPRPSLTKDMDRSRPQLSLTKTMDRSRPRLRNTKTHTTHTPSKQQSAAQRSRA